MEKMTFQDQLLFFELLIENSPNLVIFKDTEGKYLKVNNSVSKIFGLEKDQIYGKTDKDLMHLAPHLKKFFLNSIKSDELCIKKREIITEQISLIDAQSNIYYFKIRKIPAINNQNEQGIIIFGKDITTLVNAKNYLELKNKFLSHAEHIAKMGSWYWEMGSKYVEMSNELINLLFANTQITKIEFDKFLDTFPKEEKELLIKKITTMKTYSDFYLLESIFKKGKKHFRHVVTCYKGSKAPYFIGIIQDITEKKFMSYQLQLCQMIFEKANEGIVITDREGNIIEANPAFQTITGYSKEEAIGQNPRILKSDRHSKEFYEKMWNDILTIGYWEGEIWNRRKNGEVYPEILRIQAVKNKKGEITNFISIFYDLTKQKRIEEESFFYRFYDPLTGIYNREYFINNIQKNIELNADKKFAVIIIDIDNFKQINEALSYNLGDEILKKKAKILIDLVEQNNVARIGEDTFALIFSFKNYSEIDQLINNIKQKLKSLSLKDIKLDITCCFGISVYPDDSNIPQNLLRYAEVALNNARKMGINNYSYFNKQILHYSRSRLLKIEKLKDAIYKGQIIPFYQPKIHTELNNIVGFEALARWISSTGEIIPPNEFIELAEETDHIVDLSKSMAEQVALHIKTMREKYPNIKISCAINLSISSLLNIDWSNYIKELSKKYDVSIDMFQIEITESMLITNEKVVSDSLKKLSQLGILICMDDFGTGYSSLSYLKNLPIDLVKIDKSFIRPLKKGQKEERIIKAIIDMCNALNIEVCAEGVESKEQLDLLKDLGCKQVQGYYFSKPVPFEKLDDIIKKIEKLKAM